MLDGKGNGTEILIFGGLAIGAVLFFVSQASGKTSASSTGMQFSQPDPNSVAALASATAAESQAQTQYLAGLAQNGAAVAAQLAADQTQIQTAGIAGATTNYANYVTAGSNQNIAAIQANGATALASIAANEAATVNAQTVLGSEVIGATNANSATTIAGSNANAATTIANTNAATTQQGNLLGFFSNVLQSIPAIGSLFAGKSAVA